MRGRDVLMLLLVAAVQRMRTPRTIIVLPQGSREPRVPPPAPPHPSFSGCPRCGTEAKASLQESFWCRPCDRAFYPDFGALVSSL